MNPERLTIDEKRKRERLLGNSLPCFVCNKKDGLDTWEAERYLKCKYCGAMWRRKIRYKGKKK